MNKVLTLLTTLFISVPLLSQDLKVTRDFGVWVGFIFEKRISNNIDFELEQQLRFFKNSTKIDDYIVDFGGKYFLNENFKLGANLRYSHDIKRWKPTENNFRFNLDLNYKGKLSKKLKLYYRLRYQKTFVNLLSDYKNNPINYSGLRNKLKLKYKFNKKNKLFASIELFRLIEIFKTPYFSKVRILVGDKVKSRIGDFNFSFGIEQEINTDYPLSFFIVKTIYSF